MQHWPRILGLLAALALTGGPAAGGDVKAVVELFTSQGCSSCPRADKLLGELAVDERLIALSMSVDYWDYLGWRDTLALHAHSERQRGYATQRGDRQVYTPQVVINGAAETIGSDRHSIERVIGAINDKTGLSIPVALARKGSNLEVELGAGPGPAASVWILPVTQRAKVKIGRGENRGKTITYHNVVRGWTRVGEWNGSAMRASLPVAEVARAGADAVAVLVQSGSVETPGKVRGAALIALR